MVKFDVKDNFFLVEFAVAERLGLVHFLESTGQLIFLYRSSGKCMFAVSCRRWKASLKTI